MTEELLTVKQVASLFKLDTSTIWRWVAAGKLPKPVRVGTRNSRWRAEEIRAYAASLKTKETA